MLPFGELVYLPDEDRYEEMSRVPPRGAHRGHLRAPRCARSTSTPGRKLPDWFTRPEVAADPRGDLPAAAPPGRLRLVHRA